MKGKKRNAILTLKELKIFIEYCKNNSNYLRNECIIEGIRNSISHGNYRVKAESSLEECKIIFEDIYEGELTFKAQIKLLDFITLLVNNHNIISDFVEYNKIKIVKEQIDLNCLLDDVYDSFKILVNTKKIKLEYKDRNDEEIYFQGDYERLKQVIINLLKNSLEATEENGKIEISSNIYKTYLEISVEDNGIGMSKETLKNIEEMFYTTKQNGTGLGVALSSEIVKSHNGELLYTSELNKGTKATIRLPYK